jgi:ABC-type nitrate/sulfonate/bicarbonate transport system substrate-binding protein
MKRSAFVLGVVVSFLFMTVSVNAQLTTLRIGFNGFHGAAPLYLAQEVGIFKKHGMNLELIFIAGGSLSVQALVGQSLDLLMTGGPPFINAYSRGAKIKIIAGVTNVLPYVFIAVSGITTPEQLKGKRIGISRFGSNTDFVVKLALSQMGLSPADVNILQVGGSQGRLAAMKSGTIHGTVLSPEESLVAQRMGLNPLLDFIEKGVEFPHVNVVAREEYLQGQGHVVRPFLAGYLETIRYFKSRKNEALKKIMTLSRLDDRQIAEKAYEGYMRSLPDDGRPTLKGLEIVLDALAKEDPKAKSLTVTQLLDLRFLPSVKG